MRQSSRVINACIALALALSALAGALPATVRAAELDPPVTTATTNRTPNDLGWYRLPVTVTLSATDGAGSGVASITYASTVDSDQTVSATTISDDEATVLISMTGTTTLVYFATDLDGNEEAAQALTINLDRVTPTVGLTPSPRFVPGSQVSATDVRVRLAWNGRDPAGSGLRSFWFEAREGMTGPFTRLPLTTQRARSSVQVMPLETYTDYQVLAVDRAANFSRYSRQAPFQVVVDDASGSTAASFSSGWHVGTPVNALNQNVEYSSRVGATATFTFTGETIAWIGTTGPGRGSATVTLNGVTTTVNLNGSTTSYRRVVFAAHDLPAGPHTLTITVVSGRVDVDAFAVAVLTPPINNDVPTAVGGSETTARNTPVTLTLSGSDGDNDPLFFSIGNWPDHGTIERADRLGRPSRDFIYTPDSNYLGSDQLTYRTWDGFAYSAPATIDLTVSNTGPTAISLSPNSLPENTSATPGAPVLVGTLTTTDADAGDTHAYTLVSGDGSDDNSSFTIVGDQLSATALFDHETEPIRSIRVKTDDGFGGVFEQALAITVTDVNEAPTGITLSPASVAENAAAGTSVGTLTTIDGDAGETFTYELVPGDGDTNNASFDIGGVNDDEIVTLDAFDFEAGLSYTVRVESTDGDGNTVEQSFAITVTDVAERPTDLALSPATVAENSTVGTSAGTLSTVDSDIGETHTYALISGAGDTDNGSFEVDGDQLKTKDVFDFEAKPSYTVRIQTDDGNGGTFAELVTITVADVNETPVVDDQTVAIDENTGNGTGVTTQTVTDPDNADGAPLQTHTWSIADGNGSGAFAINGTTGAIAVADVTKLNHEVTEQFVLSIAVSDSGTPVESDTATVTINITDVNEAPTAVADSTNALVNTELASGGATATGIATLVGSLDLDANDSDPDTDPLFNQISVVAASGPSTNGTFNITGTGSFTYTPRAGHTGSDSFTYTLRDNGPAGGLTATGTVTVTVGTPNDTGVKIWYVNNGVDGPGTGTSTDPFSALSSLSGATGPDVAGDIIYLNQTATTYTGGLTLLNNQLLLGEGMAFTLSFGGSSQTLAAAGTRPTLGGSGLTLANGNRVYGLNVNGTSGIVGTNVGGLIISNVGATSSFFPALDLANGVNLNVTLDTVTTTDGTTSAGGVRLQNNTGTTTLSGVSISNSGGTGFTATNAGTVTVSSSTTNTIMTGNNRALNVTGPTTAFNATFASVSAGQSVYRSGAGGITLSGNTGTTTIGSVTIFTNASTGISAENAGTVVITGSANTIDSTSGTGLTVTNTTIGGSGWTFQSINASGGANGIVLNNTGATAGLTVTGNGGVCTVATPTCTGGRLQNMSGANGAIAGNGIYLANTLNPTFNLMRMNDNANNGIFGTSITGLVVDGVLSDGLTGNSSAGNDDESIVHLRDTGGTVKVLNSTLNGAWHDAILVNNTTSAAPTLTVEIAYVTVSLIQGSTVNVTGNTAIQVIVGNLPAIDGDPVPPGGGTVNTNIHHNTLTHWWGNAIHVMVQGNAAGTATIEDNNVHQTSGALAGSGGIGVSGGTLTYTISRNSVRYTDGTAISADRVKWGTTMKGTITNNTIGVSGVANSGSSVGAGIFASHTGPASTTIAITSNTLRQINGTAAAIWVMSGDASTGGGSGTMNATVSTNNIQESGTTVANARMGILVTHGRQSTPVNDTDVGCYDIVNNTIANFNTNATTVDSNNRMRVNQRFGTTSYWPGYTGTATGTTSQTDMAAYLLGRNTASYSINANTSTGGFRNTSPAGSGCQQP